MMNCSNSVKNCTQDNKAVIVKTISDLSAILDSFVEEPKKNVPVATAAPTARITQPNGAIFSSSTEINTPAAIPIFKTLEYIKSGSTISFFQKEILQTYSVSEGTVIELVDLSSNKVLVDGPATLLQAIDVQIPNGVCFSQGTTNFITGHSNTATPLYFFVLPKQTKLKIGLVRQITNVNYLFRFYSKTILTQRPKTLLRIGTMNVTSEVAEEVNIISIYED